MTDAALELHVVLDLVESHVTRTLDHHLNALGPRPFGELADSLQLSELGVVGGVGKAARPQAVAERERDVVLTHDVADVVEKIVHRVLLAMHQHPLGEDRAAPRHDSDQPILDVGQVLLQHSGVDREVVDPLLGLVLQDVEDHVVGEILDAPAEDHRVDRHRADRHSRLA